MCRVIRVPRASKATHHEVGTVEGSLAYTPKSALWNNMLHLNIGGNQFDLAVSAQAVLKVDERAAKFIVGIT